MRRKALTPCPSPACGRGVKELFMAVAIVLLGAAAAWAIVASPGQVVPIRLQMTSGGVGVAGLKPTVRVVRQDGTVFLNTTLMTPADGIPGVYGNVFVCPVGPSHFTAYVNNTGMYAYSETVPIDSLTASGGTAYVNTTSIANSVAAQIKPANILPFQGSVSYAGPVATKSTVRVKQGNTPTLQAAIKQSGGIALDLTGWTVKWAIKKNMTDTVYVLGPRDITADVQVPASTGIANINFQANDTASILPGLYYGEIQITKGAQVMTAWQCNLYIDLAVIH